MVKGSGGHLKNALHKRTATFIACVFYTYIHTWIQNYFLFCLGSGAECQSEECHHVHIQDTLDPTMRRHTTPEHNFKTNLVIGNRIVFVLFPLHTFTHALSIPHFLQRWRQDSGYIKSTGIDFGVRLHCLTDIRSFCRDSRAQSYTA